MTTEIPPNFPITICPPGTADGVETPVCRPTGRRGTKYILGDTLAAMVMKEGREKPKYDPEKRKAQYKKQKSRKQRLREKAEAIFT